MHKVLAACGAFALTLALEGVSLPQASAQDADECQKSDTLKKCYLRLRDPGAKETRQAIEGEQEKRLIGKNTGLGSSVSSIKTNTADFLPKLAIEADATGSDSDEPSLQLDLNNVLGLPVTDGYKIQLAVEKPKLYEPLRNAFDTAGTSSRADQLEGGLTNFDDYTLSFAWSPVWADWGIGRSYKAHRKAADELFIALEARAKAVSGDEQQKLVALSLLIQDWDDRLKDQLKAPLDEETSFDDIQDQTARLELMKWVAIAAKAVAESEQTLKHVADEAGFFKFADLINNQPQLHLTASQRTRDQLAGPDETTIRLTYEHGFVNLNSFNRECETKRASGDSRNYLTCFSNYLKQNKASLEAGDRISATLEYTYIRKYDVNLPADGVALMQDAQRKLVAGVGYGRYLQFDATGDGIGRLDATARYERFGGDPNRNNRAVASLSYSLRVEKGLTIVIGASYANRPEFLGETDKEVSAHLGLNYKILSPGQK